MTDHSPATGKMVDLDALERLAKEATPGEWQATDYTSEPAGGLGIAAPTSEVFVVNPAAIVRDQDARFIADANPATILALIAELRAAREVVSALHRWGFSDNIDGSRWRVVRALAAYEDAIGGEVA